MKILVVRLSSMGDVILAAPVFSFLAARYPDAAVTLLTDSDYTGFFADDPRLAGTVGINKTESTIPPDIAASPWDRIIDLQNSARSRRLVRSLATGSKVGRFEKFHWRRLALLLLRCDGYDPALHVAARYVRAAGGDPHSGAVAPPRLFFREGACAKTRELLYQHTGGILRPAIALFPFSAWKNKEWPEAHFINVGQYFLAKGWNVAVFGGPADAVRARRMKESIGSRCVSFADALSLYECGCMLTNFALALGNDTGLSHLARACGVKTGVLYGPTTRHFGFYPYGSPAFRVFEEPLACRPCHAHGGNVCLRTSRRCLRGISYKQVIRELEELSHKEE
jgi:heptosyltransferase II